MKLKVILSILFSSFALVACGEGDSNSSNDQDSMSLNAPATTGPAGTTTPTQSSVEEGAGNTPAEESEESVDEGIPGAVEQASNKDNPLSLIPREDLPKECLDFFQELENRLMQFPEAEEAARNAAEELKRSFESMEGDLEQFAQTCQDRYEDFKQANAKLDEQKSENGTPQ